jgi:hypothetical protein
MEASKFQPKIPLEPISGSPLSPVFAAPSVGWRPTANPKNQAVTKYQAARLKFLL